MIKKVYENLGSSGDKSILDKVLEVLKEFEINVIVGGLNDDEVNRLRSKFSKMKFEMSISGAALCR